MFPNMSEMLFECECIIHVDHKNVWNDFVGYHIRYCPQCSTRKEQFYKPTQRWEDTADGQKGKPMPDHIRKAKDRADTERASSGVGVRPVKPGH